MPVRAVFIGGFFYRNPRDLIVCEDQFCDMLDNIVSLNDVSQASVEFNFQFTTTH